MEEKKKSRELISERDSPPFGRSIAETFALKLPRFRDAPAARADCETIRGHNAGADVRDIWTRCTVNYGESFKFRNPFVDGHGIAEFLIHPPRHNGRRSILPSPPPLSFLFFPLFFIYHPRRREQRNRPRRDLRFKKMGDNKMGKGKRRQVIKSRAASVDEKERDEVEGDNFNNRIVNLILYKFWIISSISEYTK